MTQALVNNYTPLLFVFFHEEYALSLEKLASIVTVNFFIQIIVDFLSAGFIDRIGYKKAAVLAHILAAFGMCSLAVMPKVFPNAYIGILIATAVNAVGGGLLEVLVSPIVEACPRENKEASMSLIHSFYCWGHVVLVAVSTVFFRFFGIDKWYILALIWAFVPLFNCFFFSKVPIPVTVSEKSENGSEKLSRNKYFILFFVIMLCAGASELAMSQWASAFAENALGVSKTLGDIFGPMMFAVLMGTSRLLYSYISKIIPLEKYMPMLAAFCAVGYFLAGIPSSAPLNLFGCAVCGFSCAIMWPGAFSLAAKNIKNGGTKMFALLALAGDVGCGMGPWFVGKIAELNGDDLKIGITWSAVFPILLIVLLLVVATMTTSDKKRHSSA